MVGVRAFKSPPPGRPPRRAHSVAIRDTSREASAQVPVKLVNGCEHRLTIRGTVVSEHIA
jgi:hypothetical protein